MANRALLSKLAKINTFLIPFHAHDIEKKQWASQPSRNAAWDSPHFQMFDISILSLIIYIYIFNISKINHR